MFADTKTYSSLGVKSSASVGGLLLISDSVRSRQTMMNGCMRKNQIGTQDKSSVGVCRPLNDWPIYKLADYDNQGFLIDACRELISKTSHTTALPVEIVHCGIGAINNGMTSGYRTTSEFSSWPSASMPIKSCAGSTSSLPRLRLEWSHLLEEVRIGETGRLDLSDSWKAQVLELSRQIRTVLSPFIGGTQRQFRSDKATINCGRPPMALRRPSSRLGVSEAEAKERRLSWRRHQRIPGAQQRQHVGIYGSDDTNEMGTEPKELKRGVRDETFSVDERIVMAERRVFPRNVRRIDEWLDRETTTTGNEIWNECTMNERGRYGESIVHVLLVNHTNESLIVLLIILKLWPGLLAEVFESRKFKDLNCLHLTIANENELLLAHLIDLALKLEAVNGDRCYGRGHADGPSQIAQTKTGGNSLIERRVTGALFKLPEAFSGGGGSGRSGSCGRSSATDCKRQRNVEDGKKIGTSQVEHEHWCDRLIHWPRAQSDAHLILYDRLQARARARSGPVYLGHTPLAWAVSFRSRALFELLVERGGARVNSTDSAGNNCLHQLVINNQLEWTRFLVKQGLDLEAKNALALTPFLLACHLGRVELFEELLELRAIEFWTYSSVRCCGYPLASLDSISLTAKCKQTSGYYSECKDEKSAVSVILESSVSSNEQKSALLSTEVVKKLLEEKWRWFARRLFYRDLGLLLGQLLLMMLATLLRRARIETTSEDSEVFRLRFWLRLAGTDSSSKPASATRRTLLRHVCELAVICLSMNRLWRFVSEWLVYRNLRAQLTYNPLVVNQMIGNALVLACAPLRAASFLVKHLPADTELMDRAHSRRFLDQLEDVLLIVASPLLWSSLLFFVAAFYVTGPFVAMINYMLMRDLKQFSLIYLIFLYSFAQCIFLINHNPSRQWTSQSSGHELKHSNETELTSWSSLTSLAVGYIELWLDLFKMTLGVYEFQPYRHSILSRLFLMLFMYLIPILFNMLIALMNNTYSLIISQSERAWSFQWAKTLFALERRLGEDEKLFYLKKYSINLSSSLEQKTKEETVHEAGERQQEPNDEDDTQAVNKERYVAGLMIIKRINCTRADKRRRLIGHWQNSIRRILEQKKSRCALVDRSET